jgi:NAD(P)-dependent dehydrogenase (short-subunit alcohol dehydrogenase family)
MASTTGAPSQFRLDGRVALVTGGGRGIGRAAAVALAAAGADVAVLSRTKPDLESVVEEVVALGRRGWALPCDVTDYAQIEEAVATLPPVDVLVNSAGANIPEPFLEVTQEHLEQIMRLNVAAVFNSSQIVARRMVAHGGGSIINLSSQMGHVGAANRTVYCTTKHAVEGLTKAMAVELAPEGVRVNAVAPTFIVTPMTRPFFDDETFRRDVVSRIPLGRIGNVEDVTGAIVYLASPAAALVTGTSLLVDGGWTAI